MAPRNCSHVTLTSNDVPRQMAFLAFAFRMQPKFENTEFGEFVLASGFRIAVFKVVGKVREFFTSEGERGTQALGLTVDAVDEFYDHLETRREEFGVKVSGPPKDHPWGARSFLMIDPDGNRWEITQNARDDGMLEDCPEN